LVYKGKAMTQFAFRREELYDLVWSESLLSLSRRFAISDVGLRKMCIRMDVPLPKAGHWEKVKAGKIIKKQKLLIGKEKYDSVTLSIRWMAIQETMTTIP
jgi:hypothetical protein